MRKAWVVPVLGALAWTIGVGVSGQPAPAVRVAGVIEAVKSDAIVVRPDEGGGTFEINLGGNVAVFDVNKAALADIKPGSFIGVGAMPQSDGSQRAMQVTVFAESQRGLGEGFRPWDRAPRGTMTNGTVDDTVKSVDGPVLTVKYRGGEKKIVVPADATILSYSVGSKSDLKAGAHIAIPHVRKKSDGTLEADRINVGQGGVIPR
jgi:hypothetical protein